MDARDAPAKEPSTLLPLRLDLLAFLELVGLFGSVEDPWGSSTRA